MEIATHENVICVKGGTSLAVYLFLVDGMLIDTQSHNMLEQLIPFYEANTFHSVALTHSHEDHVGTAAWLVQNKSIPIYIHASSVEFCSMPITYQKYRQDFWGIREPFSAQALTETIHSDRYSWKAIETPGHADDHVVFYNEEMGQLFSGDLFLTSKPRIIMSHESVPTIMNSIRTVLTHDFESMFCCHAGYIADGKQSLQKKLDFLENICGEILHRHQQGHTIPEINKELFPKVAPIISISDGQFDSMHIVRSVVTEMGLKI